MEDAMTDTAVSTDASFDVTDTPATSDTDYGATEAVEYGDTDFDASGTESETTPEYIFELDEIGGVTLDEARNGYLRQADYTRKTQDLAAQRAQLAQAENVLRALEADPQATLNLLAESFGLTLEAQQSIDELAELDPDAARLARVEQQLNSYQEQVRLAEIDAELESIRTTYGDFDEQALYGHALQRGFSSLTAAYRDMMFEQVHAQAQKAAQAEERARKAQEAKRQAAAVTHSSAVQHAGAQSAAPPEGYGSIRDAYEAAKRQLGMA
jgi:hypothetical protein